jgi:putative ABC transport system permease protein
MILLQAAIVGGIGYGLGVGAAALFGYLLRDSELAFMLPWQLLIITGVAVTLICMIASLISMRKVIKLEPAIVFKG